MQDDFFSCRACHDPALASDALILRDRHLGVVWSQEAFDSGKGVESLSLATLNGACGIRCTSCAVTVHCEPSLL